jgi:hypothetical protein
MSASESDAVNVFVANVRRARDKLNLADQLPDQRLFQIDIPPTMRLALSAGGGNSTIIDIAIEGLNPNSTFYVVAFQQYMADFLDKKADRLNPIQRDKVTTAIGLFLNDLSVFLKRAGDEQTKLIRSSFSKDLVLSEFYKRSRETNNLGSLDSALDLLSRFVPKVKSDFASSAFFFSALKDADYGFAVKNNFSLILLFRDSLRRLVEDSVVAPQDHAIEAALTKAGIEPSSRASVIFTEKERAEVRSILDGNQVSVSKSTLNKLGLFFSMDEKKFDKRVFKVLEGFPDFIRLMSLANAAKNEVSGAVDISKLDSFKSSLENMVVRLQLGEAKPPRELAEPKRRKAVRPEPMSMQ